MLRTCPTAPQGGHRLHAVSLSLKPFPSFYVRSLSLFWKKNLIDPTKLREVMWAVVTRTNPATDIMMFDYSLGSLADPMQQSYEPGTAYSSRAIIDACRPFKHLKNFPIVAATPRRTLEEVRKKWSWLWDQAGPDMKIQ